MEVDPFLKELAAPGPGGNVIFRFLASKMTMAVVKFLQPVTQGCARLLKRTQGDERGESRFLTGAARRVWNSGSS